MSRKVGGVWINFLGLQAEQLVEYLEHRSGLCTLAVPHESVRGWSSSLSLISSDVGFINYVGIATVGNMVTDQEHKVQIGPVIKLQPFLSIDDIINTVPMRFRKYIYKPSQRLNLIPVKTWDELYQNILKIGNVPPEKAANLQAVLRARIPNLDSDLPEAMSFERDAIATALETFGGSRYRRAIISSSSFDVDAPFITQLKHRKLAILEDSAIINDLTTYPGIKAIKHTIVGAFQLSTDFGTLTVVNANRTKIEKTLGVDLIYYNHRFQSFVMVQYKQLRGKDNPVFRPRSDPSLSIEIERMRIFELQMKKKHSDYESFRLLASPFFLKLCKSQVTGDWNGRMLPGMYFPIDLWELLMDSPKARGDRGGITIGYENADRRFNNSEFTSLLSKGWLGTSGVDTNALEQILVESIAANHSVVTAIHDPNIINKEFIRDHRGRFAYADDEFAV